MLIKTPFLNSILILFWAEIGQYQLRDLLNEYWRSYVASSPCCWVIDCITLPKVPFSYAAAISSRCSSQSSGVYFRAASCPAGGGMMRRWSIACSSLGHCERSCWSSWRSGVTETKVPSVRLPPAQLKGGPKVPHSPTQNRCFIGDPKVPSPSWYKRLRISTWFIARPSLIATTSNASAGTRLRGPYWLSKSTLPQTMVTARQKYQSSSFLITVLAQKQQSFLAIHKSCSKGNLYISCTRLPTKCAPNPLTPQRPPSHTLDHFIDEISIRK